MPSALCGHGPGAALSARPVLSASGLGEEANAPSAVPPVLEIGGTRWALDWEAGEVAVYVVVEQKATAERLAGQLAQGWAATLTDRQGRALAAFPLAAAGPAFAALRDCVATRLAEIAEAPEQGGSLGSN